MGKQSSSTNRLSPEEVWATYKGEPTLEAPVQKKNTYRQKGRSEFAPYFRRIDNYKHRIEFFKEPSGKYDDKIRAAQCKLQGLLGKKAASNIPAENPETEMENLSGGFERHRRDRRNGRRPQYISGVRR